MIHLQGWATGMGRTETARFRAGRIPAFLAALIATAIVIWAAMMIVLFLAQDRMIYAPPAGPAPVMRQGWQLVRLSEGTGPTAYHLPPRNGMPTVLFLHGNASGYREALLATAGFARRGYGVLAPEYPGYAGNPGRPSESGLARAADSALAWLDARGEARDLVIYGNSIGSGPAVHAARHPHAILVLVSPVASMIEVVHAHVPTVPAALLRDRYENAAALRSLHGTTLVYHARDDEVVPFGQGERIAAAAGVPLFALRTGGHAIAFDPAVADRVARDVESIIRRWER